MTTGTRRVVILPQDRVCIRFAVCTSTHPQCPRTAAAVVSKSDESPIGLAGRIVTPTRGEAGPGEVELRIRGGTEVFMARSADPLPCGAAVIVLATLGPRTVVVLPWADPLDSVLDL